jgi:hypothetical protein
MDKKILKPLSEIFTKRQNWLLKANVDCPEGDGNQGRAEAARCFEHAAEMAQKYDERIKLQKDVIDALFDQQLEAARAALILHIEKYGE